MTDISRRTALRSATFAGVATAVGVGVPGVAHADQATSSGDYPDDDYNWTDDELADRERVLAIGFTEDEALAWLLTVRSTTAYFNLEELHPSDAAEVAQAVHIIQSKLMARPAYRQYLEMGPKD